MPVTRSVELFHDHFARAQALTATPGMNGWTQTAKVGAGTPTTLCQSSNSGELAITLSATSEEQSIGASFNDVLPFLLPNVRQVRIVAQVTGVDAVTTIVFGLASAYNATEDTIATNLWFRLQGSASTSNVVAESDDGTTDNDDKATGATLANVYKEFVIDLQNGLSNVLFSIDGSPVARANVFSLAAAPTAKVQPYVFVHKASGTGVPALIVDLFEVEHVSASGA